MVDEFGREIGLDLPRLKHEGVQTEKLAKPRHRTPVPLENSAVNRSQDKFSDQFELNTGV